MHYTEIYKLVKDSGKSRLVPPGGFEPPAFSSARKRSIQLSYGDGHLITFLRAGRGFQKKALALDLDLLLGSRAEMI